MNRYYSFNEFEKILEYSICEDKKLTVEEPKDKSILKAAKQSKEDSVYPEEKGKDKKTGEEKVDKSQIPKDALIKGLAKELYKAQYKALTLQQEIDDALSALTKEDPANPRIAQVTATGAINVANSMLRCDKIEAQMVATAGSDNPKLVTIATELAAEARHLAMKKALEEFGDIVKKWKKDAEKAVKDKQAKNDES